MASRKGASARNRAIMSKVVSKEQLYVKERTKTLGHIDKLKEKLLITTQDMPQTDCVLEGDDPKLMERPVKYLNWYTQEKTVGFVSATEIEFFFCDFYTHDILVLPLADVYVVNVDAYEFKIELKDFRMVTLLFYKGDFTEALQLFEVLTASQYKVPAYWKFKNSREKGIKYKMDGYEIYKPKSEYARMGLPNRKWRLSMANKSYECVPSYPSLLAVLNASDDKMIAKMAQERKWSRFPVLCWAKKNTNLALLRSSAVEPGTANRFDKVYVQELAKVQLAVNQRRKAPILYIMDVRSGKEELTPCCETTYASCKHKYLDIASNLDQQHAYDMLRTVCHKLKAKHISNTSLPTDFTAKVDSTHWLRHVSQIMRESCDIAELVASGKTVLVHGVSGWDRTTQLVALSQLLLDEYYRTIEGFIVLVEKEWISFGHNFRYRVGQGTNDQPDARSPNFALWMDCVWQMTKQFPSAFEFNSKFLKAILHELYYCDFGTFIGATEKWLVANKIQSKTHSFWSFIYEELPIYRRVDYVPEKTKACIARKVDPGVTQFWTKYYLQWHIRNQHATQTRRSSLSSLGGNQEEDMLKVRQISTLNRVKDQKHRPNKSVFF